MRRVPLSELARVFLRLSLFAFGGPVAHIALAEDEIVARRGWLTREHYLDLIAATNLIPGPNSTETMIHVGYTLRGIPGAVVAGASFILPAFLLTLALTILYVTNGSLPQVESLLWGIKPVVIAIIANAGYRLAKSALRSAALWGAFGASAFAIGVLGWPEVGVMFAAGALYALYPALRRSGAVSGLAMIAPLALLQLPAASTATVPEIFFYFLRIGSVLFGSGYILIAYIQQNVVGDFGWLSAQQLLDAIAIGQLTPGPVLTTATAVGYIVGDVPGAVVATVGIFLPSFVLVILSAPFVPRMRNSRTMSAFLAGVNAAVIAAILVTLLDLTQAALRAPGSEQFSFLAAALAGLALFGLMQKRAAATTLIGIGALAGLAQQAIAG